MSDLLRPDDTRDALRKVGGLLLGLGVLMWTFRKGEDMSDFVLFVVFVAPAAFLYGLGVFSERETGGLRSWQTVYSVFGLLFVPLGLFAFIQLIDGTPGAALNIFWVFGVTAALAFYAGVVEGIRFHLLAGSIALIVAWSALWHKILSDGISQNYGVYRGLLGILAIALLVAAVYVWRTDPGPNGRSGTATDAAGDRGLWKGSELFTGAGIAAVTACSLGFLNLALGQIPLIEADLPGTAFLWDVALLIISLGLVAVGAQIGLRGPVYVGAIGLLLFLLIVGQDLNEDQPDPTNFGIWPIVLLALGALGVALSSVREASQGDKPRQLVDKLRGR